MRSALRRLLNQDKPPVTFAANRGNSMIFNLGNSAAANAAYLRAFKNSGTVNAIVSLLARSVALPEWHMYRKQPQDGRRRYSTADSGSDQRVEVISHAALTLWENPNPFMTRFEFLEGAMQHLELCGETWWVLNREGLTFPTSMWYVRPDRIEPVPGPDYLQGYVYHGPDGSTIPLQVDEVISIKYPNPEDPYRGLSPVGSILPNIDAMYYSTEWQRNFFLNNAEPSALIQFDHRLTDTEWDEFTERWRTAHQGVQRAHRVGILENGATYVDRKITQQDMDFANLRNVTRDEIREAWGIHKSAIGNSDDVNRANAQTAAEAFGNWVIVPKLRRVRTTLNAKLLPMFGSTASGVEFDYENPLPDDREADNAELLAKSQSAQFLISAGYDPDDVSEVVGLPKMKTAEIKPAIQPSNPPQEPQGPQSGPNAAQNRLQEIKLPDWFCWNKEIADA